MQGLVFGVRDTSSAKQSLKMPEMLYHITNLVHLYSPHLLTPALERKQIL